MYFKLYDETIRFERDNDYDFREEQLNKENIATLMHNPLFHRIRLYLL